jgi:hypothetical protein
MLSKFIIRNPDSRTIIFLQHTVINVPAEWIFERVCVCAERPNPAFSLQAALEGFHGIGETTIGVRVQFNMILATNW